MKKVFSFIWELVKIAIVAAVIVIPIRYFLFQPFIVKGDSMMPNFSSGDYLIIDEISYRFKNPERGEVIVFKYPKTPVYRFIKRVIGLPGETVEIKDNQIKIYDKNNKELDLNETSYLPVLDATYGNLNVVLSDNEYFVLGDNRPYSSDSRSWGPLPKENIIGRVFVRLFPFASLSRIVSSSY